MTAGHADCIIAIGRAAIANTVEDVPPIALTKDTLPFHALSLIVAKQHKRLAFEVQSVCGKLLAKQFYGAFAWVEAVSLPSDVKLSAITKNEGIDGLVCSLHQRPVVLKLAFRSVSHCHTDATGAVALLSSSIITHCAATKVEEFWSPEAAVRPFRPLVEDEAHRLPRLQVLRTITLIGLRFVARSGCGIVSISNTNNRGIGSIGIDNGIENLVGHLGIDYLRSFLRPFERHTRQEPMAATTVVALEEEVRLAFPILIDARVSALALVPFAWQAIAEERFVRATLPVDAVLANRQAYLLRAVVVVGSIEHVKFFLVLDDRCSLATLAFPRQFGLKYGCIESQSPVASAEVSANGSRCHT